jgi:hypothetical protein
MAKKSTRTDWRKRALDAEQQVKALTKALELDPARANDRFASESAELDFWRQQFFSLQKEMILLVRWQAKEDMRTRQGANGG